MLYFPGNYEQMPSVKLEKLTPLFTEKDLRSFIRNLPAGSSVRVLGWHAQGWLIETSESSNRAEGWVTSNVIRSISESQLQLYREKKERLKSVQGAIQEKTIIPGMTEEEVLKALGKPKERSFRIDEKGKKMVWIYLRYEEVPEIRSGRDLYGRITQVTTFVRVSRGEKKVEFMEGKVVAYEEKINP